MKIVLKMNNNLSSGKVVSMSNCDPQANQLITNSEIINRQLTANHPISINQKNNAATNHTTSNLNLNNNQNLVNNQSRGVIERGASWSYNETRALLSEWGRDMVQRQLTNSKRTRHVWEKIAEKLGELGYSRSPDQVRTRVFNMIAEYRRILKNPTPERKKKCIFFEALQKIYRAKDANQVRQACRTFPNYDDDHMTDMCIDLQGEDQEGYLMNYQISDNPNSADASDLDEKEIFSYEMSPSSLNPVNQFNQIGHVQMNGLNHQIIRFNNDQNGMNRTPICFFNSQNLDTCKQQMINQVANIQQLKLANSQTNSLNGDHYSDNHSDNSKDQFTSRFAPKSDAITQSSHSAISSQTKNVNNKRVRRMNDSQLQKRHKEDVNEIHKLNDLNAHSDSYSNIIDSTTLLIDKMFEHLANGTEAMREWIKLEERRLEQDIIRRQEDREREERREQKYLEAFIKMQSQMFEFLSKRNGVISDEAKNLNLAGNFKEELNESAHKDEDENKQCSSGNELQQTDRNSISTSAESVDDKRISDDSLEEKLAYKSDETVSVAGLNDYMADLDSITSEQFVHTIDMNKKFSEMHDQLNRPTSNQTSIIKEQDQNRIIDEISLENLLQSTGRIDDHSEQRSNQSISRLDRDYYSILTRPRPQNIIMNTERMNSQVVDLEYAYKDEHECNNYSFTNVQHEEIVN